MGISLKKDDNDNIENEITSIDELEFDPFNESAKYHGGIGDGTLSEDKINDLPTYTGPSVMSTSGAGVHNNKIRSLIYKIVGILIILGILVAMYFGIKYVVSSSGKDITNILTYEEQDIGLKLGIEFTDNENKVKSVREYSGGTVTVRSGKELNIIYINGKQVGVNTSSRKYRFYNVGINDAEYDAINNMTYDCEGSMSVINDMAGGTSDTYYYYNTKNNDCLVLTINKKSNRVADMTYYTNCQLVTKELGGVGDDD